MKQSQYEGFVFILVEGDMDKRVLKRFFDENSTHLEIAYGKDNLVAVLEMFEQEEEIILIAIKDADFDRLIGIKALPENLFLTDENDFTLMMLHSSALGSLIDTHAQEEKIEGRNTFNLLVEAGKYLGALRLISLQENLNLNFKDLGFKQFTNLGTFDIQLDKLIKTVLDKSQRPDLDQKELKQKVNQIVSTYKPLELCNGHDLIALLSLALTKTIGNQPQADVKPLILERTLCAAYNKEDFKKSQLYEKLLEWAETKGKAIFR